MPNVAKYYPGDFQGDMAATLAWLYSRQNADIGNWQANALLTSLPVSESPGAAQQPTTPALAECGIVSQADFSSLPTRLIENIVMLPPPGWLFDKSLGPDGFPINFAPVTLPTGNLFAPVIPLSAGQIAAAYDQMYNASPHGIKLCDGNTYPVLQGMTIYGYIFNLFSTEGLTDIQDYRVDLFTLTDQYYYQSSAPGVTQPLTGPCANRTPQPSGFQSLLIQQGLNGWFSAQAVNPGVIVAALYPASAPQPAAGSYSRTLPPGFICHSNTGVGVALSDYFARIYAKTDIEYLQEDNIPIIVQDAYHARCGSQATPAAGELTAHVLYNDPVKGPTLVYTSLQTEAAYQDLPRSFTVPTSDPLYVPDPTQSNSGALQNRSFIYDCALGIIAYSASGNFIAAAKIVKQLNYFLDHPAYLATTVLENGEDGNSASRWSKSNAADSVTDVNDPAQPPYGTGLVVDFHATTANDSFTYSGAGFPDATDGQLEFQHKETSTATFVFDVSVNTQKGDVTDVQVTSGAAAPAAFDAATKTITVAAGPGGGFYRTVLLDLKSEISNLASDTLTGITGFKITLTAPGDLYFDNFSVGGLQPQDSLAFSYDVYNGQIDQAYIRAGAMAWVCFAYAVYMALSLDYTPALYLQRMINFLLTLQSPAAGLTKDLFYLGWGKYVDPGYQFVPGLIETASTEHQVDIYFAFMRSAGVLATAAIQLLKTGNITQAQSGSLASTAVQIQSVAETVASQVLANLYIPPASGTPGHFAQGASSAGLDTSEALDASGTWAAILAYTVGAATQAEQAIEFVFQSFYLQNQQIVKSSISNSYNQAYQQLAAFSGVMPYQNSAGGYSSAPASVWQEGTWGLILALLLMYTDSNLQSFFTAQAVSLDSFVTTLISSQRTLRGATADGSLLGYSLAFRGLPYEFEVWPMFAAAAWMWLTATNPGLLLTISTSATVLPYLSIPQGMSAQVNELDGQSSLGAATLKCIDPSGTLKGLTAQDALIGKVAKIKMGFPGQSLGDFVTMHTGQINQTGWTADGQVTFTLSDVQRFLLGQQVWLRGGPLEWSPGQPKAAQPIGPAVGANAFAASDKNPRYLQGNPIDLLLATLQNELGVGQDPSLRGSDYVLERAISVYTSQQNYDPLGPAPGWVIFTPGDDSTLINPNPYIDVPGFLALRDTEFSGDWFEFQITRPIDGKQFIEDQILKVLGLYMIARPDGRLSLKSMKSPAIQTPVMALNQKNVIGIPQTQRQKIVNVVTVKLNVENSGVTTAARAYDFQISFEQQESLIRYNQIFHQQIEATGLVLPYGGYMRAQMIADRIFRRHAFAPPIYKVKAFLSAVTVELGDYVWLNHPLVADFQSGKLGLVNVVCEVIGKRPNYAQGNVEFDLLDTRFINLTRPYSIAPASDGVPAWTAASAAERAQYMFISSGASGGTYADGTAGNTIF
ncbi:MAG: hypothetical protein KGM47_12125 [Acidobacteriota bacterium]|nr:hypothetical protein [Acidobacteriota bacterium]